MTGLILKAVVVFGVLVALFGIGIDHILPGTSPGLNLPQMLIIAAGLALALGAWQLGRPEIKSRLSMTMGNAIVYAVIITLITLLILEIVLTVFAMSTYFGFPPGIRITLGNWWVCDAPGCHYVYDNIQTACQDGGLSGRRCLVNRQGFAGSRDFVVPEVYDESVRILALGDSFTFGLSAAVGMSFIETLESRFPDNLIWNTGISGTGTIQAIASYKFFAPQLRPRLTILGFYMNDFGDNLLPINRSYRGLDPENRIAGVLFYFYDSWGNVFKVDDDTAMRYFGHGVGAPRNEFEHAIGSTRLGTLALRLRNALGELSGALMAKQTKVTREFLAELRDLTFAHNSDLLVLLIPKRQDAGAPAELYRTSIQLMEELGIPYIDTINLFDASSDYAVPPDGHWNTAGHQKVGALLSECIAMYLASVNLADCESVVIPVGRSQ